MGRNGREEILSLISAAQIGQNIKLEKSTDTNKVVVKARAIKNKSISDNEGTTEQSDQDILVLIAQKNKIYSNQGLTSNNELNRRRLLLNNPYNLSECSMDNLGISAISWLGFDKIVLYSGEKYVTEDETLLELIINIFESDFNIDNIAIIPMHDTNLVSNISNESLVKYNVEYDSELNLWDAEGIIETYLEHPEKYHLYTKLLFNILMCREKINLNIEESERIINESIVSRITALSKTIKQHVVDKKYTANELELTMNLVNGVVPIVLKPVSAFEEIDKLNDIKLKKLFKRFEQLNRSLHKETELRVTIREKKSHNNIILVKDNLLEYSRESIENHYLIQLDTLYFEPGMAFKESLDQYGLIKIDISADELSHDEIDKIQDILYSNEYIVKDAQTVLSDTTKIVDALNNEDMFILYMDNLALTILVDNKVDKEKAIETIKKAIKNTFIDKAAYRLHICEKGENRKKFTKYTDGKTIELK